MRNINTIFKTKVSPNDLACLHGIRVLTMFWIILLHTGAGATQRRLPTGITITIITILYYILLTKSEIGVGKWERL